MTKTEIRKQTIQERRLLLEQPELKQHLNMMIFERAHKHPAFQLAQSVHIYKSTPEEVDTEPFIEYAWGIGKKVYVPRVESGGVVSVEISRETVWSAGAYGILEPSGEGRGVIGESSGEGRGVSGELLDVVFVPVVAFDLQCNRIGYGKGYYDAFLRDISAVKIGLAYECQKVKDIPTEEHDVRLDGVVTEERWYL